VHEWEMLECAMRRIKRIGEDIRLQAPESFDFRWESDLGAAAPWDGECVRLRLAVNFRDAWNGDLRFYKSELRDYVSGDEATVQRIDAALRIHLQAMASSR
jgi:hypothetical protein